MKKPKIKTLPNGLRIIALPHSGKSVLVEVLVKTGSQYETKEMNGISHFLEHMCFKGTDNRSGREIMHFLDGLGCRTNAFTDDEITGYHVKSARRYWKKTLAVALDIFQNPSFPQPEIEREKGVIIGEINMYNDDPSSVAADTFDEILYGDQPAGRTILGPKENILKFNQEDFVQYHQKYYIPENTVVIVAGDILAKEIFQTVAEKFSDTTKSSKTKKKKTKITKKSAIKVITKKTEQSHLVLGFPTVGNNHKDYPALSFLAVALGGGMSSRLFEKVREELGAGYYISAYHYMHTDSGSLRISSGLDSNRVSEVLSHVVGILVDIKENGISEKELKKTQKYLTGNLIMSMESTSAQSHFYGYRLLQERPLVSLKELIKEINAVTAADIKRVTRKYCKNELLHLAIVGPHAQKEIRSFKTALKKPL
ncbi:MAG: insulinase family protein [Candidatus Pacebacteria bacterium]|nr:insulinase family protein [Candidatus Paceibacterota bacterium]